MSSPRFTDFSHLLLDLDGTLYVGDELVPGTADALRRLGERGVEIRYVTNTTSKPRSAILEHLGKLGLAIDPSHVFTPPVVARDMLLADGRERCHFLLKPEVLADLEGIRHVEEDPDAVVIGDMGDGLSGEAFDRAFRFVLEGVPFYTLTRNRYFRAAQGMRLDVGAYTAAIEFATRREAILLGKPAAPIFRLALESMEAAPEASVMVGDDIEGDVAGAMDAGIRGILVRTGKFRESDLGRGITPDAVIDSIADLG